MKAGPGTEPPDPDFAEAILRDLYEYRPRRRWLAWLLWGTLGMLGVHRFSMLRAHAEEQQHLKESGLPPLELAFMPPLDPAVLSRPPDWTARWHAAGPGRRALRFGGDVLVLLISGGALAALAKYAAAWEALVAVLVLVILASAGSALGRWAHVPVLGTLLRWSHRLRLFYYFNGPGSPPALLVRSVTATITAPCRACSARSSRRWCCWGWWCSSRRGARVTARAGGTQRSPVRTSLLLWARPSHVGVEVPPTLRP